MHRVTQGAFDRMDNGLYSAQSDEWWRPDSAFYQIKVAFNPGRVGYARKVLTGELTINPEATAALDVGCGGGFVTEEAARMGFVMTGVDPSEGSLRAAAAHARLGGLDIRYIRGTGESLPFADRSFGVVFCCDVLEHVRDLPKVIAEIARVLEPGGAFVYDTFNRTWLSWLAAIKVSQEWPLWAFMPARIHVWKMFIKPREMRSLLRRNGLEWGQHRGLMPDVPLLRLLGYLRKRAKGEWTYRDLAGKVRLVESAATSVMYMGYAVKKRAADPDLVREE